jgi:hypothetical protein
MSKLYYGRRSVGLGVRQPYGAYYQFFNYLLTFGGLLLWVPLRRKYWSLVKIFAWPLQCSLSPARVLQES